MRRAPSSPRTKAVIYHEPPLQSAQDFLALVAQWASVRIGAVMSPVRIPLVASFADRRGARARCFAPRHGPRHPIVRPPLTAAAPGGGARAQREFFLARESLSSVNRSAPVFLAACR